MGRYSFIKNVNEAMEKYLDSKKVNKEIRRESFKNELTNLIEIYKMSSFLPAKITSELLVKLFDVFNWANDEAKQEMMKKKIEEKNNDFWYD